MLLPHLLAVRSMRARMVVARSASCRCHGVVNWRGSKCTINVRIEPFRKAANSFRVYNQGTERGHLDPNWLHRCPGRHSAEPGEILLSGLVWATIKCEVDWSLVGNYGPDDLSQIIPELVQLHSACSAINKFRSDQFIRSTAMKPDSVKPTKRHRQANFVVHARVDGWHLRDDRLCQSLIRLAQLPVIELLGIMLNGKIPKVSTVCNDPRL
mmetsp:Transcript_12968/g.37587  ORF Transcript_12968/g.37587 Transcript_12968/m.37587 type:complete len:211 (-) Transcript_12968:129-761(-)